MSEQENGKAMVQHGAPATEDCWEQELRAEITRQAPQLTFDQQTELLAEIDQEADRIRESLKDRPRRNTTEIIREYTVGKALRRHISAAAQPLPSEWLEYKKLLDLEDQNELAEFMLPAFEQPRATEEIEALRILDRVESELPAIEKRTERLMYRFGL